MLNLFALTRDASRRIVRFPLAADVQQAVTVTLHQQEADFQQFAIESILFDGKYKPDDGECLLINDFDDMDNIHAAIANPLSIPEIKADENSFQTIKALFSGYSAGQDKIALIQSFDKRKIISASGIAFFHQGNVFRRIDGAGISLDSKISTILKNKELRFFSFHMVRQIFDLSQYFLEATDGDLNDFAALPSIHVADTASFVTECDSWTRRKISLVAQSQILDNFSAEDIKKAALIFNIDIKVENRNGSDVIVMPENKAEIKKLLRFLDEDYYQSVLQSKAYRSNSRTPA